MSDPAPPVLDAAARAALHQAVDDAFEAAQLPWLQRLVEQPSHTLARDDVEAAAALLDATARDLGLRVERVPSADPRLADHRVYTTPATDADARSLALVGHVDTVYPRSMGFDRFTRAPDGPEGVGEVARGPGVLDMKGGLSVIFFALRALRAIDPARLDATPLRVVCVSDEEIGSPSSAALYDALAPRLDGALVFEAGRDGDQLIVARKGGGAFTIEAHGRAAHAGNDHAAGVNAIHALALIIPQIEALTDPPRGVSANVGLIEGGTSRNTVPALARCEVDTRFARADDAVALEATLRQLVAAPLPGAAAQLAAARLSISGRVHRPPLEPTPASHDLRRRYEVHARAARLGGGAAPLMGGGSDANLLGAAGVPCVDGLGPFGRHFHNPDEWCSLTSLRRRTQALACFLFGLR